MDASSFSDCGAGETAGKPSSKSGIATTAEAVAEQAVEAEVAHGSGQRSQRGIPGLRERVVVASVSPALLQLWRLWR